MVPDLQPLRVLLLLQIRTKPMLRNNPFQIILASELEQFLSMLLNLVTVEETTALAEQDSTQFLLALYQR